MKSLKLDEVVEKSFKEKPGTEVYAEPAVPLVVVAPKNKKEKRTPPRVNKILQNHKNSCPSPPKKIQRQRSYVHKLHNVPDFWFESDFSIGDDSPPRKPQRARELQCKSMWKHGNYCQPVRSVLPLPCTTIFEDDELNEKMSSINLYITKNHHRAIASLYHSEKKSQKKWSSRDKLKYGPQSGSIADSSNLHPSLRVIIDKMDVIAAQLYVMSRLGNDVAARVLSIHSLVRMLFPNETDLSHVYTLFTSLVTPVSPQAGMEEWSASLRDVLSNWKLLKTHPLGPSISTLLSACVVLGLVGPGRFKFSIGDLELFSQTIKSKHVSAIDVFDAMVETVVYFFEVGHAILETKSLTPLLFMTKAADELSIEVSFLKANAAMATNGSLSFICEDCTVEQYRDRLAACILKLSECIGALSKGSYERFVLQRKYEELEALQSKFLASQAACCQRLRPYAGMVYASSGVGKTTFVRDSVIYALAANGFDSSDNKIITVSDTDKYDSTLRSDIEAIIDDDVANQKPKFAPMSAAARIINIVNSKPYAANMAAVEDKGKVACNAKMYFLSTNHPTLDAYETSNCPSSVLCRFQICVSIVVKPEFCTEGALGTIGMQLDSRKVFAAFGDVDVDTAPHLLDVWNISVSRPFVKPTTRCGQEGVGYEPMYFEGAPMTNVSYSTYLRFLCHDTQRYFSNQRKLLNRSLNVTDRIPKCPHGVPLIANCQLCRDEELAEAGDGPQSGAMIGTTLGWFARSWANGIVQKVSSFAVGEIRQLELATTRSLFAFCKEWQQSWMVSWTDYIPDSFVNTFIGRYAIRRAVRFRNARQILLFRMCILVPLGLVAYDIVSRRELSVHHIGIVGGLAYTSKAFVSAVNSTLERELLSRRDAISDASRAVREIYIARAVKYVGFAGLVYTSVCVLKEFVRAGRQVTNGFVFAPFGTREHSFTPPTVRVVAPSGKVLLEKSFATPNIGKAFDTALDYEQPSDPHGNLVPQSPEEVIARAREVNMYKQPYVDSLSVDDRIATATSQDVVSRMHKHLVHVSFARGDKWRVTNGMVVASRVLLVPYHALFAEQDSRTGSLENSYTVKIARRCVESVGGEFTNRFYRADVYHIPSTDFCLIYMPSLGTSRRASYLFADKGSYSGPCRLIYRNIAGVISEFPSSVTPSNRVAHFCSDPFVGGHSHVEGGTFNGLCVSPYICQGSSPVIVGLHLGGVAGSPKGIYGVLYRSQLDKALDMLALQAHTNFDVQSGVLPITTMGATVLTSTSIHAKCPTRFIDSAQCDVNVYGSCVGKATFRPTIRTSMMSPYIEKFCGVPQQWGNPCTHPWKYERSFLLNCGDPAHALQSDALHWASKDWADPIVEWARAMHMSYSPLTEMAAICGEDGIKWVDSINKNSAIGFPLTGKKIDYLVELNSDDWPGWSCPYGLGPELAAEKQRILSCYSRNERAYPIFKSCPKSESIPITKEKKRLFQVAPTGYQLVVRELFLPLAVLLGQCPLLSECSVGINCSSDEWEQMVRFLEQFPACNTIAGDYKAYDQKMGPDVTQKAWESLIHIAQALGATPDIVRTMRCVVADMVTPLVAFEGTLIELHAGNPSGQNLTAHINCIVNSLLLRVVWYLSRKERGFTVLPFRSSVALQVYGDDNLATTSDVGYNMKTISRILGSFGYVYTDAQKNLEVVPFIDLQDAEYLKRKSVFHPKLGVRVGALSQNSIFKSLHCFDAFSKLSPPQHATSVAESALFEFFLHGEEIYEERRAQLIEAYREAGLVVPLLHKSYTARALDFCACNSLALQVTTGETPEARSEEDGLHCLKAAGSTVMGLTSGDTREPGNCTKKQGSEDSYSSLSGLAHSLNGQELDDSNIGPQSGNATATFDPLNNTSHHQNVHFVDGSPGVSYSASSSLPTSTISGDMNNLGLGDFFARPILIDEFLWEPNQDIEGGFNPWEKWFLHPRVANRVTNYSRARASLKLKFTITGNGFYAGRLMFAYVPLSGYDLVSRQVPSSLLDLVEHSQRPMLMLNPTTSEGGEMHLPFFFPNEAFNLVNQDFIEAGIISYKSLALLRHAGDSTLSTKISVFAWSDDIELSAPTTQHLIDLVPQSGEIGGESSIKQRPTTMGPTSQVEYGGGPVKLTFTKDQNVSTACDVMGLMCSDEMDIASIATRQTFLTTTQWRPDFDSPRALFSSAVHPAIVNFGTGEKPEYHFTAMANMAQFFDMWRGTIKFRFVVMGSAHHRGRLKISWDPVRFTNVEDLNVGYNCIVDIAEHSDFTIEVGWGSCKGMLNCLNVAGNPIQFTNEDNIIEPDLASSNGVLKVEVFDPLTLPTDKFSDIWVAVFVSAGSDIEFAAMNGQKLSTFSIFPQSGDIMLTPDDKMGATDNQPEADNVIAQLGSEPGHANSAFDLYVGERVHSLHTLMSRVAFHSYNDRPQAETNRISYDDSIFPTYPFHGGADPLGFAEAFGNPYSNSNTVPLQWAMLSFVGYRGSIRVHNLELDNATRFLSTITRKNFGETYYIKATGSAPSGQADTFAMYGVKDNANGFTGNHINMNPCVEAEIPFHTTCKFLPCKRNDQLRTDVNEIFQYFAVTRVGNLNPAGEALGGLIGFSAGSDFRLGFYTGLPVMYLRETLVP